MQSTSGNINFSEARIAPVPSSLPYDSCRLAPKSNYADLVGVLATVGASSPRAAMAILTNVSLYSSASSMASSPSSRYSIASAMPSRCPRM
jgi:hypothetical protein